MAPFIIAQLCFCLLVNWEKAYLSLSAAAAKTPLVYHFRGCVTPARVILGDLEIMK